MAEVARAAEFLELPETVFSGHDWTSILSAIATKAAQYEELESRNLVLSVEAEQAKRDVEQRVSVVQTRLDEKVLEIAQLQARQSQAAAADSDRATQRQEQDSSRVKLETTVRRLNSTIDELNQDKTQALALIDRQNTAAAQQEQEYKALSSRYTTLREENANVELQLRQAKTATNDATLKRELVEQELALEKKNSAWLNQELSKKIEEFAAYRRDAGAQISRLQQQLDDTKSQLDVAKRAQTTAQASLEKQTEQLNTALGRVAEMQTQLVSQEEAFRAELASQKRLAELWERSLGDARARVEQLENAIKNMESGGTDEVARIRTAYEQLQQYSQGLATTIEEMREESARIQSELDLANERLAMNGTAVNGNGHADILSPTAHAVSKLRAEGSSVTELYSEVLHLRQDLQHERNKNVRIQSSFDKLISELEERAPQIQEQRQEYSQLQSELITLSDTLQTTNDEKERQQRALEAARTHINDQTRELELCRQQMRDMSRQIQSLLFEIEEEGFRTNALTEAEITQLNRLLEQPTETTSAVDTLISNRLVLFRNIQELQQQNARQLQITRQLGAKMEQEEELNRRRIDELESDAIRQAQGAIARLNKEVGSLQTKLQASIHEKDILKRLLAQQPASQQSSDVLRGPPVSAFAPEEQAELQRQFDVFREESNRDHKTLTGQVESLGRERGELEVQAARLNAQLELAGERANLLNNTIGTLRQENTELRTRFNELQSTSARQDARTQQIAEDLVSTKSQITKLTAENLNHQGERQLWKTAETRLTEELTSVRSERDKLLESSINLQARSSESDRSHGESAERFSKQIASLQSELEQAKSRLKLERDEVARLSVANDLHLRESGTKVESLLRQVADAREAHAIATTQRDGHATRIADLETQLQAANERVQVFSATQPAAGAGSDVSREQALQLEIIELKATLEQTRTELQAAEKKASEMETMASSAETALAEMNSTHDTFVASIQAGQSARQLEVQRLEQRVSDLLSELSTANAELGDIREQEAEKRRSLDSQIRALEARVQDLADFEQKYNMATGYYEDDLRVQAEIAQEAQQNYETELLRHAEAAQALRALRNDYNELKADSLALRAANDNNESRLESEHSAWQTQRDLYERETSELRARIADLEKQNRLLHDQLEAYSRVASNVSHASADGALAGDEASIEGMQEVIKYLRREKEIVDVKFELLQQETRRAKLELQQLDKNLQETKAQLTSERTKRLELEGTAGQRDEILAKMNELNLYKESNSVLRGENEANTARIRTLQQEKDAAIARIEPLELSIRMLQSETTTKDEQINLLREETARWKARNQQILQKYERIDPAELQELREKVATAIESQTALSNEKNALAGQVEQLRAEVTTANEARTTLQGRYDSLSNQVKERIKKERTEAKDSKLRADAAEEQLGTLRTQFEAATNELETLKTQQTSTAQSSGELQQQIAALQQASTTAAARLSQAEQSLASITAERDVLKKELDEARIAATSQTSSDTVASGRIAELEQEVQRLNSVLASQTQNAGGSTSTVDVTARLNEEIAKLRAGAPDANADLHALIEERVQAAQQAQPTATAEGTGPTEEQIQTRIDAAVAEVRAELATTGAPTDVQQAIAEALKVKEAEHAAREDEMRQKFRAQLKTRVDEIVEDRLAKKLEAERQTWTLERSTALEAKDKQLADIGEKHQKALDNLKRENEMRTKLQIGSKDKQIATLNAKLAELQSGSATVTPAAELPTPSLNPASASAPVAAAPPTPSAFGSGLSTSGSITTNNNDQQNQGKPDMFVLSDDDDEVSGHDVTDAAGTAAAVAELGTNGAEAADGDDDDEDGEDEDEDADEAESRVPAGPSAASVFASVKPRGGLSGRGLRGRGRRGAKRGSSRTRGGALAGQKRGREDGGDSGPAAKKSG